MVIELQFATAIVIFLGGYFLGRFTRKKPHCSGRLIIDEKGETERWSFIFDDDVEDVREKDYVNIAIDRRT